MKKIDRDTLYFFGRYSNLSKENLDKLLKEYIYNSKEAWFTFIRYFLISLGIGFVVLGIVFFFTYNWGSLSKFLKLGITQGFIILATALVLFAKLKLNIQKIILTGAAILVGVLLAVLGQVYQTGANAYDFFLTWTICISFWVVTANFAVLWMLYLILINTSFILYIQQVASVELEGFISPILFTGNALALLLTNFLYERKKSIRIPKWFLVIIGLVVASIGTFVTILEIFDRSHGFLAVLFSTCIYYILGLWYGIKTKNSFYLSVIPFGLICILAAALIKKSQSVGMLLFVCLFFIISTSLVIKNLLRIRKNEE